MPSNLFFESLLLLPGVVVREGVHRGVVLAAVGVAVAGARPAGVGGLLVTVAERLVVVQRQAGITLTPKTQWVNINSSP